MQCDNSPRKHTNTNFESLLLCCYEDMCNHVDRPDHHKKLKPNLTSESEDGKLLRIYCYISSICIFRKKLNLKNSFTCFACLHICFCFYWRTRSKLFCSSHTYTKFSLHMYKKNRDHALQHI